MKNYPLIAFGAAALLLALSRSAHSAIIHFTNPAQGEPGHYDWHYEAVDGWESWLDITAGPDQQSNQLNGNSIAQAYGAQGVYNWTNGGAFIQSTTISIFPVTLALDYGTPLAGLEDHLAAWHVVEEIKTFFPEGEIRYMGVRTLSGNYGWIEVERTGMNFTAYAWAYETEPGVSIDAGEVPAPATLGLLAVVAFRSSRRRPTPWGRDCR
ncbi:MAG: hypothetical protein L0Y44_00365 [Phycisphaerales bacterium]|nr:hypothetical protein [Phycisphaerales bacterium]MCI0674393.1 hypothetical protein [Phycisphaerales bacterium]